MDMNANPRATKWTRREALSMLGMGAAAGALPGVASAAPSFPEGAVIRTILKDYPPQELGDGATLFHEHMSLAPDFLLRFRQYAAEAPAGEGLLIVPVFGDFAVLHAEDVDVGALLARRRWRHLAQQPDEIAFGRSADEFEGWDRRRPRRARWAVADALDQARQSGLPSTGVAGGVR